MADYIARWDGESWHSLGLTPLNGAVYAIAVAGANVYVGGNLPMPAESSWRTILPVGMDQHGTPWEPVRMARYQPSLSLDRTSTWAVPSLRSLRSEDQPTISPVWNGTTGTNWGKHRSQLHCQCDRGGRAKTCTSVALLPMLAVTRTPIISPAGRQLLVRLRGGAGFYCPGHRRGPNVYVEHFSFSGLEMLNHIAGWDGSNWYQLGDDGLNDYVSAVEIAGTRIYAGGAFTSPNHIAYYSTLQIFTHSWSSLGSG